MDLLRRLIGSKSQMAIWVFDSNKIGDQVTSDYGAYAEMHLLQALGQALRPHGGWQARNVVACHGDLFTTDIVGDLTGTALLSEWVGGRCSGVVSCLGAELTQALRADRSSAGFIPYAVGAWPVAPSVAAAVDQGMRLSASVGYLGYLLIGETARLSSLASRLASVREAGVAGSDGFFMAVALALSLPVKMGIRKGKAFGWLVSDTELESLGLTLLTRQDADDLYR
ncbi:MAG: hypothetical protein OEV76_06920 [Anaerolineae bacterium]|nr:hypothetical protein [Anaerolineae bacterium]